MSINQFNISSIATQCDYTTAHNFVLSIAFSNFLLTRLGCSIFNYFMSNPQEYIWYTTAVSGWYELNSVDGVACMKISELYPLISLIKLKQEFCKLPKEYLFTQAEALEFLSRRRWPESDRYIDRTTFWRWRNDAGIQRQKVFSQQDILKLCQICDHYRIDGTRREYLNLVKEKQALNC